MHLLEVRQMGRELVSNRIDVHVDDRCSPALDASAQCAGSRSSLRLTRSPSAPILSASRSKRISPRSVLMVRSGGSPPRVRCRLRIEGDLLVDLHHAPLPITEDEEDHGQIIAYGRLHLLRMKAHRAISDDAIDGTLGPRDLGAKRL